MYENRCFIRMQVGDSFNWLRLWTSGSCCEPPSSIRLGDFLIGQVTTVCNISKITQPLSSVAQQLLVSCCSGLSSIPLDYVWDLWWTQCKYGTFSPSTWLSTESCHFTSPLQSLFIHGLGQAYFKATIPRDAICLTTNYTTYFVEP